MTSPKPRHNSLSSQSTPLARQQRLPQLPATPSETANKGFPSRKRQLLETPKTVTCNSKNGYLILERQLLDTRKVAERNAWNYLLQAQHPPTIPHPSRFLTEKHEKRRSLPFLLHCKDIRTDSLRQCEASGCRGKRAYCNSRSGPCHRGHADRHPSRHV